MDNPTGHDELRERLAAFIAAQTGRAATITELEPLAGGGSLDSWRLAAQVGDESLHLVLRRDLESSIMQEALSREQEFRVMRAAFESGVRAPRPRWYSADPAILGRPFFLMDYVEGTAIGRVVVKAQEMEPARQVLPELMAEQLALIHAVDVQAHALDFLTAPAGGLTPALQAIEDTRKTLDRLDNHNPALEFGLRWLERHAPPCPQLTLVHGDFRLGNFQIGLPHGLNAVIDWEFSHLGDPLEDLAWPCVRDWRFGYGHLRLAGIADREPFIAAYERHSGRRVDRRLVDYWEIMGNLRWAVACLGQADRHLSGQDPSVEFASLGRRSAEMQLEMLRLIQQQGG